MNRSSSSPRFSAGFVLPWFGTTIAAFAFAGLAFHYLGGLPPNNGSDWSAGAAVVAGGRSEDWRRVRWCGSRSRPLPGRVA